MDTGPGNLEITFPARFHEHAEAALFKLQVRYPAIKFSLGRASIDVSLPGAIDAQALRREVLHAIYAEKIYAETLPMRQALVAAVTAR
jgi:hypothetical protein